MKYLKVLLLFFMITSAYADDKNEQIYLKKVLQQLDAIKLLVIAASNEQPGTNRIKFHYESYRDHTGKKHKGLLDDINTIYAGIKEKLDGVSIEPRNFEPIVNDYIEVTNDR